MHTKGDWARRLALGAVGGLALALAAPPAAAAPKKGRADDASKEHQGRRDDGATHDAHADEGHKTRTDKGHKHHAGKAAEAHARRGGEGSSKVKGHDKAASPHANERGAKGRERGEEDRDDEVGPKRGAKKHEAKGLPALSKPARAGAAAGSTRPRKTAQAGAHSAHRRAEPAKVDRCQRDAVDVSRATGEAERFALTRCNGKPADHALEHLSVLMRPYSARKPDKLDANAHEHGGRDGEIAPGVKLADAGLLSRLQAVASHYPGKKVVVVSGYRPTSSGSYHKHAKALDLHVEGVKNEDLVTFCRSLVDTGCGYYPNSSFVHLDVRPKGSGHVYWIDAAGPGEAPRYVRSWPPKNGDADADARPDHAAPADEQNHPDVKKRAGKGAGELDRDHEGDDQSASEEVDRSPTDTPTRDD